ncbi:Fic family protein [Candidatus Gracilibacteria bacterium]|nr:Fic family protein [Candidatus Gracilibacteria bacterium]
MKSTKETILDFIDGKGTVSYKDLKLRFTHINESTLVRHLNDFVKVGKLQKKKVGRNTFYFTKTEAEKYFDTPTWERKKVQYNPDFLRNYIPNETRFFTEENLQKLQDSIRDIPIDTDFYKNNKRFVEQLLIDLSFASSYLEGNTYSYLDTEVLLKYNEINKAKTEEETQMILNHKKAIEYLIYYKKELTFDKHAFFEIHSLLGDRLLLKSDLGVIRNNIVEIGGSTYTPLDNRFQLEEEFELFLEKMGQIKNPFEQSLFIMIFIPYFQLFLDINKRTSRIMGNLPLIKNNLPVLSMIQLEKKKYIIAILSVYELNDVSTLQQLWTDNYLINIEKYKQYFS